MLKDLTQGHSARKGQSQNLKHGTLAPRPGYQPTALCCPCMDYLKERGRLAILLTHQCSDAGIFFLPISTLPLGAEAPFHWRACDSSGPWKIGVWGGAFRGALQKTWIQASVWLIHWWHAGSFQQRRGCWRGSLPRCWQGCLQGNGLQAHPHLQLGADHCISGLSCHNELETRMLKAWSLTRQRGVLYWKLEERPSFLQSGRELGWTVFSYFVKAERRSHVFVCLTVEISKQSVEGAACLFLNPGSKMQKERDEERVVKQKGIRTWRFGKFCLLYCKKKEKACSE